VGFEAGEAVLLEAGGDLEALLDGAGGAVAVVEAAAGGAEEPDAGGEAELELEGLEVAEELLGGPQRSLGAQVLQSHSRRSRERGWTGEEAPTVPERLSRLAGRGRCPGASGAVERAGPGRADRARSGGLAGPRALRLAFEA